jgi:hypothetical protein
MTTANNQTTAYAYTTTLPTGDFRLTFYHQASTGVVSHSNFSQVFEVQYGAGNYVQLYSNSGDATPELRVWRNEAGADAQVLASASYVSTWVRYLLVRTSTTWTLYYAPIGATSWTQIITWTNANAWSALAFVSSFVDLGNYTMPGALIRSCRMYTTGHSLADLLTDTLSATPTLSGLWAAWFDGVNATLDGSDTSGTSRPITVVNTFSSSTDDPISSGIVGLGSIELDATGQLQMDSRINGSASIDLGASGQLQKDSRINGLGSIVLDASGQLREDARFVGAGSIELDASGQLQKDSRINGEGSIVLDASGQLQMDSRIVGAGSIVLDASGQLQKDSRISGEGSIDITASGTISSNSESNIVGIGAIILDASGQLQKDSRISGEGSIDLGASGQLQKDSRINGSASIVLDASGQISATDESVIVGSGSIVLDAAGQLQMDSRLVGAGSIVLGASGQLQKDSRINGEGSIVLDANGILTIAGDGIIGLASISLDASGQLQQDSRINGEGSIVFTAAGQLQKDSRFVGIGAIELEAAGVLSSNNTVVIVGEGAIVLGASGQLQLNSVIDGVGSIVLDASGQLQKESRIAALGSIDLGASGQLQKDSRINGEGSIVLGASGQLLLPTGLSNIVGVGSILLDAAGQLTLEMPCCDDVYPHPLTRDEAKATLVNRYGAIADKYRQLYTNYGLRSRRVFLVWSRWTGEERGEGHERLLAEIEILPTPRISDATSIQRRPYSAGTLPEGSLFLDQISMATFTQDILRGWVIPAVRPTPRTCAERNMQPDLEVALSVNGKTFERGSDRRIDFWYEIVEDGRGDFPASRSRYRVLSDPSRKEGSLFFSLVLERADEARDRSGNFQIGINESVTPNGFWLKGR